MSTYTVQTGDTPMLITHKLLGNPTRVNELVRSNAHKPTVMVGKMVTFRDLAVGERLTIPPRWMRPSPTVSGVSPSSKSSSKKHHVKKSAKKGVSGHAYPQPAPHYVVAPRAGGDGGGDDSGHGVEPILAISGRPGQYRGIPSEGLGKSCCASCASGGPCESGCPSGCPSVQMPPCSAPQAPPSIPGSTSFPVGFGQAAPPAVTTSTVASALSGWGVPLAVGAISIAAGFGLAYVISHK